MNPQVNGYRSSLHLSGIPGYRNPQGAEVANYDPKLPRVDGDGLTGEVKTARYASEDKGLVI
jgi:hypothetical protein